MCTECETGAGKLSAAVTVMTVVSVVSVVTMVAVVTMATLAAMVVVMLVDCRQVPCICLISDD